MDLKPEFKKKKVFVFDLDGTVYRGKNLIPNVDTSIKKLIELGKKVYYLTNNATKTRESFAKKICDFGIHCIPEQIITSAYVACKLLISDFKIKSVFILGSNELMSFFTDVGINVLNLSLNLEILFADFLDKSIKCDAVVCAMDHALTYAKIRTGMELINRGAEFFATNGDKTFPESGQIWPGAGMTLAALESCVGRPPKVIFGKPNTFGIDLILNELNQQGNNKQKYEKSDILIVGDRLETDIVQANNAGIDSVLVLTGISSRKDVPINPKTEHEKRLIPSHICSEIKDLFN
jgi:HAD superfamily hydrolase (TIGR01450 family)